MHGVPIAGEYLSHSEEERAVDLIRLFPTLPRTGARAASATGWNDQGSGSERFSPPADSCALDVGAREGRFSLLLAERFERVVALDLEQPKIDAPGIECRKGDVAKLPFADRSFDFVLCAEVLEHLPAARLEAACRELARVTRHQLLIGVPYRQDTRIGRTVCAACQTINPPWGHVNEFDEKMLVDLFPSLEVEARSFAGSSRERTNCVSTWLMDYAGNPYGTYTQLETCIACNAPLAAPPERSFLQKLATRSATTLSAIQARFSAPRPQWIHMRFRKR